MSSRKPRVAAGTVLFLILLAAVLVNVGCRTQYEEGQILDIPVEPGPGEVLTDGIVLDEVRVTVGTFEEDRFDLETLEVHSAGDPCLLVSGRMCNTTEENRWVSYRAFGRDSSGTSVAWTLTSHHLPGRASLGIFPLSCGEFELELSWSDNIEVLEFRAATNPDFWPYDPMPPSESVPESEMARIIFSRDWLVENDVEPDSGTIRVTFPTSWMETPPAIPEGEETVELSVPTQLLMDSNTSKNPDEMTVTLPNRYFKGL